MGIVIEKIDREELMTTKKMIKSDNPVGIKKLLGSKILVKYLEVEQKTLSGIIVPQCASERERDAGRVVWQGEVIKLGEDIKKVKVGDKISLVPVSYECPSFKHEKDMYIIVSEEDILAVMEK